MRQEQSINGWYITDDPYEIRSYRNQQKSSINTSYPFKVYLCPSCNRAHENAYECGLGSRLYYYDNFPKFKLKKSVCKICQKNNNV